MHLGDIREAPVTITTKPILKPPSLVEVHEIHIAAVPVWHVLIVLQDLDAVAYVALPVIISEVIKTDRMESLKNLQSRD